MLIGGALFIARLGLREGLAWLTRRWALERGTDHPGYVLSGVLGLLSLLIASTFGWRRCVERLRGDEPRRWRR